MQAPSIAERSAATRPTRALALPLWWAALTVLAVNDHLLKHADLLPGWLTGKLSDLAGLIVAPVLVAVACRVRTRRGLLAAHGAVGLVFAAINVSPAAAGGFESLTALTPFPWHVVVDPTDLLALVALGASWRLVTSASAHRATPSRWLPQLAFGVGALTCAATSPPVCEGDGCEPVAPDASGALVVGNDSGRTQLLRIRPLADGVEVSCDALLAAPAEALSRRHFGAATLWELTSGRATVLTADPAGTLADTPCHAFLVDGPELDMTLVAWSADDYPITWLSTDAEDARVASPERLLLLDPDERRIVAHDTVFPAPPDVDPVPPPACAPPTAAAAVDWSVPLPFGAQRLVARKAAPDGCLALDFESDAGSSLRWYLCAPPGVFPFDPGDEVYVSGVSVGQMFGTVEGLEVIGAAGALRVARGADVVAFGDGSVAVEVDEGCQPSHDACGSLVAPLAVGVKGTDLELDARLTPGGSAQVDAAGGILHVVVASERLLTAPACSGEYPGAADYGVGTYVESVYVQQRAE